MKEKPLQVIKTMICRGFGGKIKLDVKIFSMYNETKWNPSIRFPAKRRVSFLAKKDDYILGDR